MFYRIEHSSITIKQMRFTIVLVAIMKEQAEELHQESLKLLAKLASSSLPFENDNNVLYKSPLNVSKSKKTACNICHRVNCGGQCNKENQPQVNKHSEEMTPKKDGVKSSSEPLTPTANLKMLVCAASVLTPADSKEEKRQLFITDTIIPKFENKDYCMQTETIEEGKQANKKGQLLGRKEKSLGLLCKRFMMIYPEYSPSGTTILLDDVVKSLGIGRRRVYDIVNVLESMEMMVRQAKNKYLWYGKSRLPATLTKLKALAFRVYGKNTNNNNNYKSQYLPILPKVIKDMPRNPLAVLTNSQVQFQIPTPSIVTEDSIKKENTETVPENKENSEVYDFASSVMDYIINCDTRKENSRSLGILCQKFLMLFMVAEDSIVTLDRAAKFLIDENEEGPSKYKTKVRRLYDIANILTSIKFLEKTTSYENAAKKAAYKWVGIDLKSLDSEEGIKQAFQSLEFSATRHSLLANVPRSPSDLNTNRKLQCRSASAHQLSSPGSSLAISGKVKFPRTFSATTVPKESFEDGFDIDQCSEQSSDDMASEGTGGESPNQVLFKEKLKKLQKEFPDKLSQNGLDELLSSGKSPLADQKTTAKPRRSLCEDFSGKNDGSPPKKMKLDDFSEETRNNQQDKQAEPTVSLVALKPLLSYGGNTSLQNQQHQKYQENIQSPKLPTPAIVANKSQQKNQSSPAPLTPVSSRLCQPILVSNIGNPMSIQKGGGLYQIIPLQCKQLNKEKAIPVFIGQQQMQQVGQRPATSPSSNVLTMLMRSPIVTVTSPSVLLSPRNFSLRRQGTELTSQPSDRYPEYFTPPHALFNGQNGKPPAKPIIFPKMTPETPSSDTKSVLTAVTRKLMSVRSDESA